MPIDVACRCGMRSRAPDSFGGKTAKCPGCGTLMVVPLPAQVILPPSPAPLPQFPPPGFEPLPTSYAPLSAPQRPMRPAAASDGVHPLIWLLVGASAFAFVGVLLVVSVLLLRAGPATHDRIAAAPEPEPTLEAGPEIDIPLPSSPLFDTTPKRVERRYGPAAPTIDPMPATTEPMPMDSVPAATDLAANPAGEARPDATEPVKPLSDAESTGGKSSSSSSASESPLAKGSIADLPNPLVEWQSKQTPLRGMQRFPDKMPVFGYSWMVDLLPYLGHQKVYDRFDRTKSWAEDRNLQATTALIPQFLNPADSRTHSKGYPFHNLGLSHYVGMSGVEDARNVVAGELPRTDPRAGVFGYDEIARPDQIKDGASQTIMIVGSGNLVSPWVQGGGATVRGARAPYFDNITGFGSKGLARPGAQVLMADGSVRAIPADIDPKVFRAMCTIGGADTVDLQSVPFLPAETSK